MNATTTIPAANAAAIGHTTHFINGVWSEGNGQTFPVTNPLDDSLVADVAAGGRAEAEAAVAAAAAAFPAWAAMGPTERQRLFPNVAWKRSPKSWPSRAAPA